MPLSELIELILGCLYWVVVLACVIAVLLEHKNPLRTLSWVIALVFIPFVGILCYWVLGRSFRRQERLSRKERQKIANCTDMQLARSEPELGTDLLLRHAGLIRMLRKTSGAELFANNSLKIYTHGKPLFEDLLQDIATATQHVHVEYFIIESDETGEAFKEALIRKAREGVEVRLIYDDVGSWKLKRKAIREMKQAGVKTESFFRVRFPYFTNTLNNRNHRKIVVIDGRIGYMGGFNIADRYTQGNAIGVWRDTHIRFEGDAVAGLQTVYLTDWLYITRKLHKSARFFPISSCRSDMAMQIVGSGPDGDWQSIMQGFCQAFYDAKRYIYIQTPYFLPNESVLTALETAALRGVDVRLMIPYKSDARIPFEASLSYMKSVLASGIRVLQYQPGFIHAKTVVIDDELSIIGSANLDFRSFDQNFEVSAFIYNAEKGQEVRNIFLKDEKHCSRLRLSRWERRPWWRKLLQGFARLFSPAL